MNHIPQLLNRASRRFQLGVPREAKLDPYGTWAVLEDHIGTPPFDAELWDRIRRLAARVTGKRGRWGPWTVDVGAQRAERGTVEVDPSGYGYHRIRVICGQCADTGDACPHILAFTLAAGYAHEGTRARMQTPGWQRFLGALRGPPEAAGRSARSDAPRPGWLRVVLHRHGDGEVLLGRLASVWYVRRAARGGHGLKPKPFKTLEKLDRAITGLGPGERIIVERLEDLRRLHDGAFGYRAYYGHEDEDDARTLLCRRMRAEIFAALGDVRELALDDGTPLTWRSTPWRAALEAVDGPEGSLVLGWRSRPTATFDIGPGYVAVDGVLRPLADDAPPLLLQALAFEPPPVPADQVPAFIDALGNGPPVTVAVESEALPVTAGVPQPRLALAADGEILRAALRFGYGAAECGYDDPDRLFDAFAEPPTLIERDREAERDWWRRLGDVIDRLPPAPTVLALEGDAAYDLLADLDLLDGFEVATDRSLDLRR